MIEQIYNRKTQNINWDNVWSIDEFKTLIETKQSTKWHKEGNVSVHTKMVVDAMSKEIPYDGTNGEYRMIMMLSALFHDIGKGVTTFYNYEKSDWSAKNHAECGEEITRKLLWNEDPFIRETICYFVRNHMKPLYICESPTGIRDIITLSCDTIYPKYCNLKNLILLKRCDNLGAMFEDDGWVEKLEFASTLAEEMNCLTKPYVFKDEITQYNYFNHTADTYPIECKEKPTFEVFVGIGSPSKFSPVTEFTEKEVKILFDDDESIDIIDQVIECCENENNFIIDLNTIPECAWEILFNMIHAYHGKLTFVYGSNKFQNYLSPTLSMSYINAN